ncbi:hypothetical protein SAMN04244571_04692 [Azotobacter beijerinckii]|uniref:Uncharacterized protein n=1 Tax=Azotobacter beijerinckii TaxID=170623 RepID=A0A1I1CPB1_9GAMM|nr:hypothetical protein SAMN04244571_04692 [Azotobacter beijerinckii]
MQLQVHSDNHIEGSARLVGWVRTTVASKFERYDEELTRVVIRFARETPSFRSGRDSAALAERPCSRCLLQGNRMKRTPRI